MSHSAGTQPTDSASSTGITCREIVALVTDYLDGALPEHERARFETHLEECDGCRRHLEQVGLPFTSCHRIGVLTALDQITAFAQPGIGLLTQAAVLVEQPAQFLLVFIVGRLQGQPQLVDEALDIECLLVVFHD